MKIDYRFSVAPMMGYTTPHARYFYRLLSKKSILFTEMVASQSLLKGDERSLVYKNKEENPTILQVGGSEENELIHSVNLADKYGFDGINLNVGCPSKKVQKGKFGACLMKEPNLVKKLVKSMINNTNLDVSVKCRTGVDNEDSYEFLKTFIGKISEAGCKTFFIHARKAILKGLSPSQNRTIPKLEYEKVYKLKKDFPESKIIINGGIIDLKNSYKFLDELDGIMIGRLVQKNPFILLDVDSSIYNMKDKKKDKKKLVRQYFNYINENIKNQSAYHLLSPLLGMFFEEPGAKKIRQKINDLIRFKQFNNLEKICINFVS